MSAPHHDEAEPDMMAIGSRCSFPECRQTDFLPFMCSGCQQLHCLEHRTAQQHKCPAPSAERPTIICPMCASAIKLQQGQDPNEAFEQHTAKGCDPSNYAKVHKKPKCPVPGCREKLTAVNTYRCKDCGVNVCLKHRYSAADHTCRGRPGTASVKRKSSTSAGSALRNFFEKLRIR